MRLQNIVVKTFIRHAACAPKELLFSSGTGNRLIAYGARIAGRGRCPLPGETV